MTRSGRTGYADVTLGAVCRGVTRASIASRNRSRYDASQRRLVAFLSGAALLSIHCRISGASRCGILTATCCCAAQTNSTLCIKGASSSNTRVLTQIYCRIENQISVAWCRPAPRRVSCRSSRPRREIGAIVIVGLTQLAVNGRTFSIHPTS